MSGRPRRGSLEPGASRAAGPWPLAWIVGLPPLLLLLDVLRPLLFERRLLEHLAWARFEPEPLLRRSDIVLLAIAALGLATAAWLAAAGRREALAAAALAAWSSVLALVGFEAIGAWRGRPYVYPPGLQATFTPDPAVVPGITGPSRVSINEIGLRGPAWDEGDTRILAVGGSTTICLLLDDAEAWPQRLMALLNERADGRRFWVGNAGKSGRDSLHHLALLERLPEAREVDVILILAGVNDLKATLRLPYDVRERLAPARVFDVGGPRNPAVPYVKQTVLYRSVKGLLSRGASPPLDIEDTSARVYAARRKARHGARKDYPLPALEPHLAAYKATLSRIARLCRGRGTRCVFLTQPTLWQDPMPPDLEALTWFLPIGETGRTVPSSDLARAMAAFNGAMLEMCREEPAECFDLAAVCPKDASVFYDDEHFHEAGADLVARAIADYLVRTSSGGPRGR